MTTYTSSPSLTDTLAKGDTVVIRHKGITYELTVDTVLDHPFLRGREDCPGNADVLRAVFGDDYESVVNRIYGYTHKRGWFPTPDRRDVAALTRVVRELFRLADGVGAPPRTWHQLGADDVLSIGDTVVISITGRSYKLTVESNHVGSFLRDDGPYANRAVLTAAFGTEYERRVDALYGYGNLGGDWPMARKDDVAALTRVVRELFRLADGVGALPVRVWAVSSPLGGVDELRLGDRVLLDDKVLTVATCSCGTRFRLCDEEDDTAAVDGWFSGHESLAELTERVKQAFAKRAAKKAEAPPTPSTVTLELTRDEAQFLRQVTGGHVIGHGPARQHNTGIYNKLNDLGFSSQGNYPLSGKIEAVKPAEPKPVSEKFQVGQVWRGPRGHLLKIVSTTRPGEKPLRVEVVHCPHDQHQYSAPAEFDLYADGTYSRYHKDSVDLVGKISD